MARQKTSHLKSVPETKALRETLRDRCIEVAARLDKTKPLGKADMETIARGLLEDAGHAEGYVGWTMVALASAFWHDQVAAVAPSRRLFLLPHCLKHAEGCPADYDEFGLDCEKCGACSIADFRQTAEEMGYKVLVAEGSPIVMKIIVSGYVDAIVGVACLNVLEKAIDKILRAGIPCMAVPLLSSDCRNTSVDEDWVHEMIHVRQREPAVRTRTYVHLMRSASQMFAPEEFQKLVPQTRGDVPAHDAVRSQWDDLDPIAATEALGYDFMIKGGKHLRPFITLAAYDALTGGRGTHADGDAHLRQIPDAVRRVAVSIEAFHKASLVHDDIEDDDCFRYGQETLHKRFGVATAINVGDFLIGLGYRLVASEAAQLGADVAAGILHELSDAHRRLSEGQGAELVWRDARRKALSPTDALRIYALKTAPAFEAALSAGLRMGGAGESQRDVVRQLSRHLGIAFQILNDLNDWQDDADNKRNAYGDVLQRRPTVLWALASANLSDAAQAEMQGWLHGPDPHQAVELIRRHYRSAGVFEQAHRLVDKYQQRAEEVVESVEPEPLRDLYCFLIDLVLARPAENAPVLLTPTLPADAAVVA